jgi:hypothetical protein
MNILEMKRKMLPLGSPQGDSGGGGGGSGTQTNVTDLPDWAKPAAQNVLARGEALSNREYTPYGGERIAGFNPLQQQSFGAAQQLGPSAATEMGIGAAGAAANRAMDMGYNPMQAVNQYQGVGDYASANFQNRFAAPGMYQAGQFGGTYDAPEAYQASGFQNRFAAPGMYQAGQFSTDRVSGPQLEQFQMGPAERVRADTFGGRQAAQYMSPYIEQALEPQLREAQRSSEMQRNANQAQAVQQGAFGGSRQAIVEAERQRNLGTQMGDIRARGLQTAYEQASQQFNQDAARRLQAQQLNQQAGLTVGGQNLQAALGTQQLGAQTGLQAALANQQQAMQAQQLAEQSRQFGAGQGLSAAQLQAQYGLSADQAAEASKQFAATQSAQVAAQQAQANQAAQQAAEQSRQFGAGQGLSAAQLQAQYGLSADQAGEASRQFAANQAAQQAQQQAQFGQSAQQLAEQSRQFGAGFGMQGLQTALQGASQLGALGQQQFGQQKEAIGLQNQFGAQQQALDQQRMSQQYQDFLNQQRYPYQQLEFMSNLLRGTPMGTVQSLYGAQPTAAQSIGSLGMGAYGLSQLAKADGGTVSSYADGGSVTDEQNVDNILGKLSDAQLHQARDMAMSRKDAAQVAQIDQELAQRASIRSGLGNAFNAIPQERQEQMMASGGIVAFAGDDDENEDGGLGQLVGGMMPTEGNPEVYKQLTGYFPQLLANVAKSKYTPMTDEKYNESISTRRKMLEEGAGPSPYADIKEKLATMRGEGEKELSQGRGLAALQAAAAMSQGRGLVQGLGRAGGAFAESYGKALQADSAQKRALMNMEMNAADAMRKERMGLNRDAIAAADQARKDHDAAQQYGIKKASALANVAGKFASATKPTKAAGSGAPKPLKLAEQLAEAETLHETNPSDASLARVTALRRAMDRARTSDFGPTRAGLGEASLDVRLGDAINTAQQKLKFTPDYVKADAAGKAQMMRDEAARVRANANKGAGVNNNSPRTGQTDYSNLWGGTGS